MDVLRGYVYSRRRHGNIVIIDWCSRASDQLGVAGQPGGHFVQGFDALEEVVLEDGGELVLDGGQEGHHVERVDSEVSPQVGLEVDVLHLDDLQVPDHSQYSGFDLAECRSTSLRSMQARSWGCCEKLGCSIPARW